jgi:hypothetical protein
MTMNFRRTIGIVMAVMAMRGVGPVRGQQVSSVPNPITGALNARYPGWVFPAVSRNIAATFNGKPFFPNLVFGDYDGDRRRDYAVRIVYGKDADKMQTVIAFLARGQTFEPHVLDIGPPDPATYLWPALKGAKDHDYETNKDFVYANDGVMFLIDEKAGVAFVYEKGEFRRLVTSD